MRKETVNTFSDGMSLDLNPLGTPTKTLTNCLNGTLITYNGNELTLQNDMGNAPVGTAKLPDGYIPIGMKEHGGIIYVASYNPKTNKGQVGCFPSPQQIYTSEAAQTTLERNIQDIFIEFFQQLNSTEYNIPVIQWDEYKEEIFKDAKTQEARIFNIGDKFIIKTNSRISDIIRQAIDENVLVMKLYIIPSNGDSPIELTNCNNFNLKTYKEPDKDWNKSLWVFQNVKGTHYINELTNESLYIDEELPFETILNNYRDYLQTYPGPQGTLQIVFEFNTFQLFNLYRIFKKVNDNFSVKFIGEAEADVTDICNPVSDAALIPLSLYGNINESQHNLNGIDQLDITRDYTKFEASTKEYPINNYIFYDIMPASKYGVLKLFNNSFLKSGELSKDSILSSHNRITNWSFEIDSNRALISWTYTTFEGDPEIDHMRFVFIPLDEVMEHGGLTRAELDKKYISNNHRTEPSDSKYIYTIKKSYYSGDFEDSILIDTQHLSNCYIYLCRLDIIYKDHVENGHDYKLLYTGTFFNDKDISKFNNSNRPRIETEYNLQVDQSYTVKNFDYTVIMENEDGEIKESDPKPIVNANDIMFLANHDKYYKKIIGIIMNVECEISSTLYIKNDSTLKYKEDYYAMYPNFAGTFSSENTLDACAKDGKITCKVIDESQYKYIGDGDSEVQKELINRVEKAEIKDGSGDWKSLNNATVTYYKQGTTYQNTCTVRIHRGIVSRFGQEDFYSTTHEGLFPVYEPGDNLYNEKLFGFKVDEDGNLSNIIGGEDFMGLSLWLAVNRKLDATTTMKDSMIAYERSFGSKTALSRFDFKGGKQTPYHYGSYISEGVSIVNYGSEGTSRIEAMKQCNYAPIQIIASNEYERVWDKSYWDGNVDGRICNLMVLPHSEIGENTRTYSFESDTDGNQDKHYGRQANHIRTWYVEGIKDNIGKNKRGLFPVSHGSTRSMYILWRSQYGYQLMNIATPLDIESNQEQKELITVAPSHFYNKVQKLTTNWDTSVGDTLPVSETHLRADHMLFCLLSQILITKKKVADLLLNAPDIAQIYHTGNFKTTGALSIQNSKNPVIVLNGIIIEDALSYLLSNGILHSEDNFIPKFYSNGYSNGSITCGGKISINTNRWGLVNLENLFYAEGTPEFSTVTDEERVNIWPGKIKSIFGQYLCNIETDEFGKYVVNTDLVHEVNGVKKFYKVFLPVIHSHTNNVKKKYNCQNTEIYKQILEGFAYNDVLFPTTRILKEQGKDVTSLNSQEDLEQPFFNLLYYNSIYMGFSQENIFPFDYGIINNYNVPMDYSHGFAFISIFGDQSRYLDSDVFLRNTYAYENAPNEEPRFYYNAIYNKGFETGSSYNFEGKNGGFRDVGFRILSIDSPQFTLGTQDWATSTTVTVAGTNNPSVNDTNEDWKADEEETQTSQ